MMKPKPARQNADAAAPNAARNTQTTETQAADMQMQEVTSHAKRDASAQGESMKAASWWGAKREKKAARAPTRRDTLELLPIRNPALEWEEIEGQIVLHIKRESNLKTRLISLFLPVPASRDVVLDAIGTHVWKQLDGATTVGDISRSLAREFKLLPREAEISLRQFFQELGRRGYVGFVKIDS